MCPVITEQMFEVHTAIGYKFELFNRIDLPAVWMQIHDLSMSTICLYLICPHHVIFGHWDQVFYYDPNRCTSDWEHVPVVPVIMNNALFYCIQFSHRQKENRWNTCLTSIGATSDIVCTCKSCSANLSRISLSSAKITYICSIEYELFFVFQLFSVKLQQTLTTWTTTSGFFCAPNRRFSGSSSPTARKPWDEEIRTYVWMIA